MEGGDGKYAWQDWVFSRIRYLKCTCNGTGNGELYGTHVSRRHIIFIKGNHKFAVFIEVITFIAC